MQITNSVVERFREAWGSTFADSAQWKDAIVHEALCQADSATGGSAWGKYSEDCHNFKWRGMKLYAAHWLYVFFGDGDTGNGLHASPEARLNIASQSVRDESVQYRVAQMMDAGNDWLTYSVYGQMFYEIRKGTMGARIV